MILCLMTGRLRDEFVCISEITLKQYNFIIRFQCTINGPDISLSLETKATLFENR